MHKQVILKLLLAAGILFFFSHCESRKKTGEKGAPKSQSAVKKPSDGDSAAAKAVAEDAVSPGEARELTKDSLIVKEMEKKTAWNSGKKPSGAIGDRSAMVGKKPEKSPAHQSGGVSKSKIRILSTPAFAQIRVDGVEWDETPMTAFRTVSAGSHHITLKHRNYPARDTTVFIKPGARVKIKMNLRR